MYIINGYSINDGTKLTYPYRTTEQIYWITSLHTIIFIYSSKNVVPTELHSQTAPSSQSHFYPLSFAIRPGPASPLKKLVRCTLG